MATVTFSNGKSVTFNGTPTSQDIEEVAQKIGVQPDASSTFAQNPYVGGSKDGSPGLISAVGAGARQLGNIPEQAALAGVSTIADAEYAGLNKLTGQNKTSPFSQGMQVPSPVNAALDFNPKSLSGQDNGLVAPPPTPAGFMQRAGQAAQLPLLAIAPATSGVLKNAALGAGSGVVNALAGGEADPSQIARDGVWGGIFGAGIGATGSFFSHIGQMEKLKTGVSGVTEDAIAKSNPDLVSTYINSAKDHGDTLASLGNNTPVGIMDSKFLSKADIVTNKLLPQAGAAIDAAKAADGAKPLMLTSPTGTIVAGKDAVNSVMGDINSVMGKMTGRMFGIAKDSGESLPGLSMLPSKSPVMYQVPGSEITLKPGEEDALTNLHGWLQRLQDKPTVGVASDMLKNIKKEANFTAQQFGKGVTPVEGAMNYAYGAINRAIQGASPALADANKVWGALSEFKNEIGNSAGKEGQSASLLMRRALSGDQATGPGGAVPVLNALDAITHPSTNLNDIPSLLSDIYDRNTPGAIAGSYVNNLENKGQIDSLLKNAVLGKWATNMFGTTGTKQLFAEGVKEGQQMAQGGASIFGYPKQWVQRQLGHIYSSIGPDAEKYALSVAKGNPQSMNPFARILDSEVADTKNIPLLDGISKELKAWGVSGKNLDKASQAVFKTWLLNRLSQPKPYGFPNGGDNGVPSVSLPSSVPQNQPAAQPISAAASSQNAQNVRSLQPAQTGQAMSAQARKLGVGSMPSGMSLGNPSNMNAS